MLQLSVIAQAAEFKSVRLKGTEKALFREINQSPLVKFPIKVNLDLPAQKISLIIQAVLCGLDVRNDQRFSSQKRQYNADIVFVFQHAPRLAKCIVDCQLAKEDSEATRNAMELSRSLGAHAWDDSPLQLAQIEQIGPVAVRKLASAGIRSIEDLENTEPSRIEMALSRNPPFGFEILSKVDAFPKLHVSMKCMGKPVRPCVNLLLYTTLTHKAGQDKVDGGRACQGRVGISQRDAACLVQEVTLEDFLLGRDIQRTSRAFLSHEVYVQLSFSMS